MPSASERVSTDPRVLLAEDDVLSRRFLEQSLRGLDCLVSSCSDGASTLAVARERPFDVWLLDRHLPDTSALALLERLQDFARKPSLCVLSSADCEPFEHSAEALHFDVFLAKPCDSQALQALLCLLDPDMPWLDDRSGLDASGAPENLRQLRELLAAELRELQPLTDASSVDRAELEMRLHRLQAACGFCGAAALAAAARRWREAPPGSRDAHWQAFRATLQRTRVQLFRERHSGIAVSR